MSGGLDFSVSNATAFEEQSSRSLGGNAGISFGAREGLPVNALLISGVALAVLWLVTRRR